MLRYFKYVAAFTLGVTATKLAPNAIHILVGIVRSEQRGDVMTGIEASSPYNLIALFLFIVALVFLAWYSRREQRQDDTLRSDIRELITEIKQGRKEQKAENNITGDASVVNHNNLEDTDVNQ